MTTKEPLSGLSQLPDDIQILFKGLLTQQGKQPGKQLAMQPFEKQDTRDLWQVLSSDCRQIKVLSAGLSNHNYQLICDSGDKVLRVNRVNNWCHRPSEINCWQQASNQGVAPALLWVSECYQIYLSEFVAETDGQWASFDAMHGVNSIRKTQDAYIGDSKVDVVANVLSLLTTFSQLALPKNAISVTEQYQQYQQQLDDHFSESVDLRSNKPSSGSWRQAYDQLQKMQPLITHWLEQLEACLLMPQFCHRDLTPHNLLWAARSNQLNNTANIDKPPTNIDSQSFGLKCIDFEYATASHPLFDLACVLATHDLSVSQADRLVAGFFILQQQKTPQSLSSKAHLALPAAINCFWLFSAMWALLMAATHPQQVEHFVSYYKQYVAIIDLTPASKL